MIRIVASFLLASLALCQITTDARSATCDQPLPVPTPWNGKPLPPPLSEVNTIYLYDSPAMKAHVWAIAVDGDRIAATVDLKAAELGGFLGMNFGSGPDLPIYKAVIKGTPIPPTAGGFYVPCDPRVPPCGGLLIAETAAISATWTQVVQDFLAGQVCPLPH